MAKRSGTGIRTKTYSNFRGVDFSTDPSLVDDSRSPWAPNIVADMGGMPEKRPGWRVVCNPYSDTPQKVNGIFFVEFNGKKTFLIHRGTTLFSFDESNNKVEYINNDLPDSRSTAVYMGGYLWIFTGEILIKYDGNSISNATDNAYVPLTIIGASPSGGGQTYESINYLSPRQKIGYLADGKSIEYKLPYTNVDNVISVEVNQEIITDYQVDKATGTITFTEAPPAPLAGGEDNVFITFSKKMEGYTDMINKCRIATLWGVDGRADRIIASGNPDYPNFDFTCEFNDGTYWPVKNYQVIGTPQTAIMGYLRLGEYLAIVKEDNGQDSTVFIRSATLDEYGEAIFSTKPCISGAGAISPYCFGNIDDEQLFLTGSGIYALTTNSLTSEKIVQNRSYRIDPLLTREKNLTNAVSVNFDGAYMVFVNGKVYGLDGKQPKSYPSRADTAYLYECFHWDNVPATVVEKIVDNGHEYLYFGTEDGRICKLNTDIEGLQRFNDEGNPITAVWSTKADDDGDPMILKTLLKKGNAVTIKPYQRSSADIYIRTDKDAVEWKAASGTMDIFNWEDIDFDRFTFNANDAPSEIPLNRKVKNYKRLQFVVKNNTVNEGFGIYGIVKHFVTGNFAKK